MSTYRDVVRNKVLAEQQRQDDKWGVQNHHDLTWMAILTEEVGEVAQAILKVDVGVLPDSEIEAEIVQVAAVAMTWLEGRARRPGG